MIKLICFLKRKPGMSVAEFRDHWLHRHGPLIRASADFVRHVVRYEQNHRLDADYEREDGGGFDGVTVQWFRKAEDFLAIPTWPSYRETIHADEERFLDRASLRFVLTEESTVMIDRSRSPVAAKVKLLCLLRRHPDLERARFHQHWQWNHGPIVRDTPELARHLIGYEQNHRLDRDYRRDAGGGYDGVAEAWFASLEEFERFCGEPAYAAAVVPDEGFLLDRAATRWVLTGPPEVILS